MDDEKASPARRLNPFAFPSETNVRFTLFIFASLGIAIATVNLLLIVLDPDQQSHKIGLLIGVIFLIFVFAAIIYSLHPKRLQQKNYLSRLDEKKDANLYREIQNYSAFADIFPPPDIMIEPGFQSQNGQAYGLPGRYILLIGDGLRLLFRKAPDSFRAILLHELAHIANKDIGRTYFAQALWNSTLSLGILPLAAGIWWGFIYSFYSKLFRGELDLQRVFTINMPVVLYSTFQVAIIVILFTLVRASLLRAREYYADIRVALWGAGDSLLSLLEMEKPKKNKASRRNLWSLHPDASERIENLTNPARIFRMSSDLPFMVGFLFVLTTPLLFYEALGYIIPGSVGNIFVNISDVISKIPDTYDMPFILATLLRISAWAPIIGAGFIFIGLLLFFIIGLLLTLFALINFVSGTIGLEIQRESVADLIMGRPQFGSYLRLWLPAVLMTFGLELGFLASFEPLVGTGFLVHTDPVSLLSTKGAQVLLFLVFEFILVVTASWLWLVFVRYTGQKIYGTHTGSLPPAWKRRGLNLILGLLWFLLFMPMLFVHENILFRVTKVPINELIPNVLNGFTYFLIALTIIGFLFCGAFIASWIAFTIFGLVFPPCCPKCKKATNHKMVLGKSCEHCGSELAPWLFAAPANIQTLQNRVTS